MPNKNRGLKSAKEVAGYLGVSDATVYRLLRSGQLQASVIGGQWRISDRDVHLLMYPKDRASRARRRPTR